MWNVICPIKTYALYNICIYILTDEVAYARTNANMFTDKRYVTMPTIRDERVVKKGYLSTLFLCIRLIKNTTGGSILLIRCIFNNGTNGCFPIDCM